MLSAVEVEKKNDDAKLGLIMEAESTSSASVEMSFGLARVSSPRETGANVDDINVNLGVGDVESDYFRGPPGGILRTWKWCKMPSEAWERGHTFYMLVFGTLIPLLVCFGSNFGVAMAIFMNNPPPTMWSFGASPPIAGNYAAIIIVQTTINFPLVGALGTLDTLNGLCPSLSPSSMFSEVDPDTWLGWLFEPSELVYPPILDRQKLYCRRVFDTLRRIGAWILIQFVLIWPLFTGISYRIWGDTGFNSYPQPEFMSAVLGGVLALFTCPIWTLITMVHMGMRIQEENAQAMNAMRFNSTGGLGRAGGRKQSAAVLTAVL